MVGDDFHGQVRFAISGAASDWSADTGRIFRINPIHVERNVVPGGAASGNTQSFFHHGSHAALVDSAHGKNVNPRPAHIFFFYRVDVADADQHTVLRRYLGREIENI